MKIKTFQKNLNSDKQFNEILEREINDWLASTPNISITDAQIASSVIVRPGRKEVYIQALCMLSYDQAEKEYANSRVMAKLLADTVIQSAPLERERVIENAINDWTNKNPSAAIQLARISGDSASWVDDFGRYSYCSHTLCLLLSQSANK